MQKGAIKPDHIATNKFNFKVAGAIPITVVSVSGLEEETSTTTLPDRTAASNGTTDPIEFTVTVPSHHTDEIAFMELWLQEGKDPVSPLYKKAATLECPRVSGQDGRVYTMIGVFAKGRSTPDLDAGDDGEEHNTTYSMMADSIIPS